MMVIVGWTRGRTDQAAAVTQEQIFSRGSGERKLMREVLG